MSDSRLDRAESVFSAALEKPAAERVRFVVDAFGDDAALRERVLALLKVHERAQQAIRAPGQVASAMGLESEAAGGVEGGVAAATIDPPETRRDHASSMIGQRIGRYVIRRLIGSGGMGMVYEAEQTEPVRRLVALKIIKWGMDTHQVLARFEAERQALAMMDHPSIARIYDAGATDSGRPYFVMELVQGIPITQYCDQQHLSTRERLDLFMAVCHAVQHAHQKGIIHRDIKPSNVLVTLQDDRPVPKVIDFGVAKATNSRLTEQTVFTEFDQLIGTPEYMSPEQAEMDQMGIDTRSDIFSLGVLLYELLTGTTPFDAQTLRSKGFAEIQRIIREVEPPKPSTRLSSMESLPSVAAHRHIEPAQLTRLVRGDLDWIAMKCLEKDRTRRYETANALAMDVQRHLTSEPVVAAPPGVGYRFRKFARRNRKTVVTAGLVAALLVLGLTGTSFGLVWALRERERAQNQLDAQRWSTAQLQVAMSANQSTADKAMTLADAALALMGTIGKDGEPEAVLAHFVRFEALLQKVEVKFVPVDSLYPYRALLGHSAALDAAVAELRQAEQMGWALFVQRGEQELCGGLYWGWVSRFDGGIYHMTLCWVMQNILGYLEDIAEGEERVRLLERKATVEHMLDETDEGDTLLQIGVLHLDVGKTQEAAKAFRSARDAFARVGAERPFRSRSRQVIVGLTQAGDFDTARAELSAASALLENADDGTRREILEAAVELHQRAGDLTSVREWAKKWDNELAEFEARCRTPGNSQSFRLPQVLEKRAKAQGVLGDIARAEATERESIELKLRAAGTPGADAIRLNEAAWALLTADFEELRDPAQALTLAQRACKMTGNSSSDYLETLALAHHQLGNHLRAAEIQREAISTFSDGERVRSVLTYEQFAPRSRLTVNLARFEAALREQEVTTRPETTTAPAAHDGRPTTQPKR